MDPTTSSACAAYSSPVGTSTGTLLSTPLTTCRVGGMSGRNGGGLWSIGMEEEEGGGRGKFS